MWKNFENTLSCKEDWLVESGLSKLVSFCGKREKNWVSIGFSTRKRLWKKMLKIKMPAKIAKNIRFDWLLMGFPHFTKQKSRVFPHGFPKCVWVRSLANKGRLKFSTFSAPPTTIYYYLIYQFIYMVFLLRGWETKKPIGFPKKLNLRKRGYRETWK